MTMSNYLTDLDNERCIFNDNIECDSGYCFSCQYYHEINNESKQLEMEEVINKYGKTKEKERRRK